MDQLYVLGAYVLGHGRIFYFQSATPMGINTTDVLGEAAHYMSVETAEKAISFLDQYDSTPSLKFAVDTHAFWSAT